MSHFDLWVQKEKQRQLEQEDHEKEACALVEKMLSARKRTNFSPFTTHNPKSGTKKVVRDINEIRQSFNFFDVDCSGYIETSEFLTLLARLMQLPKSELDMTEVWGHWDAMDTDGDSKISFEEFSSWYRKAFDIEEPDFRDFFHEGLVPKEHQIVREVARQLGAESVDVEKMYTEFKRLDVDDDGRLSFDEFKILITTCSRKYSGSSQSQDELPPGVVQKFWNEIGDKSSDGCCKFESFAAWYVNFFYDNISPMEHYYQSLGRRRSSR